MYITDTDVLHTMLSAVNANVITIISVRKILADLQRIKLCNMKYYVED